MFTGKSPSKICFPAGRNDHPFGKRKDPSVLEPGQDGFPDASAARPSSGAIKQPTNASMIPAVELINHLRIPTFTRSVPVVEY
jgi:hypothetical protein